ncbi:hypothetical protein H0H81_008351, partial [Sphagnurus paluster]
WMDNIKANNPAEAPIFNIARINDWLMQEMHAELKDKADAAMQQKMSAALEALKEPQTVDRGTKRSRMA